MVVARGCSGAMTVGILTVHSYYGRYYERGHQSIAGMISMKRELYMRGRELEGNEICGAVHEVGKASFQSHAQTSNSRGGLSWDLARHTHV